MKQKQVRKNVVMEFNEFYFLCSEDLRKTRKFISFLSVVCELKRKNIMRVAKLVKCEFIVENDKKKR